MYTARQGLPVPPILTPDYLPPNKRGSVSSGFGGFPPAGFPQGGFGSFGSQQGPLSGSVPTVPMAPHSGSVPSTPAPLSGSVPSAPAPLSGTVPSVPLAPAPLSGSVPGVPAAPAPAQTQAIASGMDDLLGGSNTPAPVVDQFASFNPLQPTSTSAPAATTNPTPAPSLLGDMEPVPTLAPVVQKVTESAPVAAAVPVQQEHFKTCM